VTQQFNTATSMGRLVLNVLLSFAQFEREIISERTRDKIAAARRKGKWAGGHPILGYDVDPRGFKLVVNESEAERVRAIFKLYLEHGSLLPVVQELERRRWRNKRWTTRKGRERGGIPFGKTNLHKLLTNVAYTGRVRYKSEVHAGEHSEIVGMETWQQVQSMLQRNGRTGGALVRNKFGALLKGLINCKPCGCAMTPSHSTKNGTKRYRYYVCTGAQKQGWQACPSKSIPAQQIEQFVVDQIRRMGQEPALLHATIAEAQRLTRERIGELQTEQRAIERDLTKWSSEVRKLASQVAPGDDTPAVSWLADLQERIRNAERRATEVRNENAELQRHLVQDDEVERALVSFDPLWASLTPREQVRIVQLLVERVDFDGLKGKVSVTFRPSGIKTLAGEFAGERKEKIA
jgi:site-specific DNA recombinase